MVVLEVPARGHAFAVHTPLRLFTGLKVCRVHQPPEFDAPKWMNDETRRAMEATCAAMKKAPPDFKRARLLGFSLESPEVRAYESATMRKM